MRGAHRLAGGRRPAAPWLAPLPDLVPPDHSRAGSRAAQGAPVAGLVDEPDLQRVSPLTWRVDDGSWLLSGPSGSGRTTALRAVVHAAAAVLEPAALHVHVIDARGALADLADLPHVGTRTRPDDPRACAALVRHLRAEVDHRLDAPAAEPPAGAGPASTPPAAPSGAPVTLVVVDGWDHLVEAQPAHAPDELPGELLRVLRDGRAVGVVGLVAGGRSLLHPRWGAVGARTFLLGTVDPLDAALAGIRATDLSRDPPPGRAVRVHDRREVQFVAATPADTALLRPRSRPRPAVGGAWRLRPLPSAIRLRDVVHAGQSARRRRRGGRLTTGRDPDRRRGPHRCTVALAAGRRRAAAPRCRAPGLRPHERASSRLPSPFAPQADSLLSSSPDRHQAAPSRGRTAWS